MITVRDVFAAAGLTPSAAVPWGSKVALDAPGVYVVASMGQADVALGLESAPISRAAVDELLAVRPELLLDGARPTPDELTSRLASMWLPGEPVLYIGMASSSVHDRVASYYNTKVGARSPHAGGWPLKTLSILKELSVFVASSSDPERAEALMLAAFVAGVPAIATINHCDPARVMPFANLEYPTGTNKRHRISGAREPRQRKDRAADRAIREPSLPTPMAVNATATTQPVTEKDIAGGRIRIPAASKAAFPVVRQRLQIELRGRRLDVAWDPRTGPDRERSGVLSVPRDDLAEDVRAGERLAIELVGDVVRLG